MIPKKFRWIVIVLLTLLVIDDFRTGSYIAGSLTLVLTLMLSGIYLFLKNENK